MTSEWLISQFRGAAITPRQFSGSAGEIPGHRGDHNLNPDFAKKASGARPLKPAAVLIPIINRPDGLTVVFTKRSEQLSNHPGQISFPGGHTEEGDDSPEHAALRETEEEVGIARQDVRVLGQLDDYITRTGFVITPVVGLIEPPVRFTLDTSEVAEVFEVPLSFLLEPSNHARHSRYFEGSERFFYAMPYNDYFIWGATAGMLINLYQFLVRS